MQAPRCTPLRPPPGLLARKQRPKPLPSPTPHTAPLHCSLAPAPCGNLPLSPQEPRGVGLPFWNLLSGPLGPVQLPLKGSVPLRKTLAGPDSRKPQAETRPMAATHGPSICSSRHSERGEKRPIRPEWSRQSPAA